ncbi:unnamed protein product [Symbiodinium natans]|uniref:Uncharacterized protein n=1 Tax=Symbiodinium natans TaxID=878477 RepID=A0A812HRX4_9DINO|nr:unnamed protein product [Symbiodinium natans]
MDIAKQSEDSSDLKLPTQHEVAAKAARGDVKLFAAVFQFDLKLPTQHEVAAKANDIAKQSEDLKLPTQHEVAAKAAREAEKVPSRSAEDLERVKLRQEVAEEAKLLREATAELKDIKQVLQEDLQAHRTTTLPPSEGPMAAAAAALSRLVHSVFAAPVRAGDANPPAVPPASLASFWESKVTGGHTSREFHEPKEAAFLQRRDPRTAQRGLDFTRRQEDAELEEVSISEPFKALEEEDLREAERLKALDRRLRQRAARRAPAKAPQRAFQGTDASSTWAALEEEDEGIESALVDLDDPRRPVDLRRYQELNAMQARSMERLEGAATGH